MGRLDLGPAKFSPLLHVAVGFLIEKFLDHPRSIQAILDHQLWLELLASWSVFYLYPQCEAKKSLGDGEKKAN